MNIGSRPEINRNNLVGQSHVDSLLNPEGDIKEDFVAASIHLNMTHFRCRRNVPYSSELEILQLSHWSETEIYVKSVIARGTESEIHDDDTNVIFFSIFYLLHLFMVVMLLLLLTVMIKETIVVVMVTTTKMMQTTMMVTIKMTMMIIQITHQAATLEPIELCNRNEHTSTRIQIRGLLSVTAPHVTKQGCGK